MEPRSMLKYAFALAAGAALYPLSAQAADVTLCAGRQGGGYDGIMRSVAAELERKGNTVTVLNLGGSEDILDNLNAGKCSFGPAQADIFYKKNKESPGGLAKVVPVDVLYNEAMQMVCSASSGYDELSDLQAGDGIIVDVIGSGSSLTWDNMVAIEKEYGNGSSWAAATPSYSPLDEAGAALALGQAKCAFGVGKVPIDWMKGILDRGGTLSEVYDKDINDLEFNGASLYEPVNVDDEDDYGDDFDTYKVPAILFKSGKIDPDVEKLVKRVAPSLGAKVNTVK
jgi:hypothetical protein